MKNIHTFRIFIFTCLALAAWVLSSCRTTREAVVTTVVAKPITTNKLIRNLENNAFEYKTLDIKRISCQYEDNKNKASFRATLQSVFNKSILLSFSKMNIPVGKLLLTRDSVKFVNYINNTYFLDDYSYLSQVLNMDLDFETVHSILTNNAFSFRDEKRDNEFKEFTSYIDSGLYVLQSVKDRKLEKITRKGKERKASRYLKKQDEEVFILQKLFIDPGDFRIRKITLEDNTNKRAAVITFSDFTDVDNQRFPGAIDMDLSNPEETLKLRIKLGKFELNQGDKDLNIKIPEKFKLAK